MFAVFKQVFKSTNKDLRNRVLFTLVALAIFSLGNAITVPGMKEITSDLGFLELLNAMSGGGLKQFSIFALGVMPYISASIIIQILQMDIIPYFKELKELGEEGRNKVNKITRYVGIVFSFVEGYVYSMMFIQNGTALQYIEIATILTAGTAFLLWLGDQITQKGIGNGVSLIIMAGIVNTLPSMFGTAFQALVPTASNAFVGILSFSLFILLYIGIVVGVIFTQEAERRIPIQYSNRTGSSSYGGKQTFLPFKLNSAGVMPVIFASMIMSIPNLITYFVKSEKALSIINTYFTTTTPVGFSIYIILIILFSYIYTYMVINPEEVSKNLNKNGGYIPGIRPGKDTQKHLSNILGKITFLGSIFIAIIAALPIVFTAATNLPSSVKVGGTSILIVIGVVLEIYKQLSSSVASRNYNMR